MRVTDILRQKGDDVATIAPTATLAEAAEVLAAEDPESLTAAVLRIHAARAGTAKREVRLLSRFTGANPHVSIVGVPSLPFDVSDLEALRVIADQITGAVEAA